MFEKLIDNLEINQSDISCCRWFNVLTEETTETVFSVPDHMDRDAFSAYVPAIFGLLVKT